MKVEEMSGEQLNRHYHELEGRQEEKRDFRGFHWKIWIQRRNLERVNAAIVLPALHLDANLAIAEADRVFNRNWTSESYPDARVLVGGPNGLPEGCGVGRNAFCEAILKALIASKEKL